MAQQPNTPIKFFLATGVLFITMLACARTTGINTGNWSAPDQGQPAAGGPASASSPMPFLPPTRPPGSPILTPTPDALRLLPTLRADPEQYIVQPGDTLNEIAQRYMVSPKAVIRTNGLINPDLLEIGQELVIPPPTPDGSGPRFKVIPDSELVYGPVSANFELADFVQNRGGYLSKYAEEIDGQTLSGTDIVARVAQDFSVNPRLLLATLEYQSGWVTQPDPEEATLEYPLGLYVPFREGLYRQLSWAADNLNRGFYLWRVNALAVWVLADGVLISIDPTINAGTAGVQHLFSQIYDLPGWEIAVSEGGLFATYNAFFNYPFDLAIEPLLPENLTQPTMQLPFEQGVPWSLTGGPHGGWGSGSAWAALDFAPPGRALGCVSSDAWVVTIADGPILRAENGAVVQDIESDNAIAADGLEQTGWTVLYMHIESHERVKSGSFLRAGERIGHPSCEGGVSSGTHVHLARRYNGEWIPADQSLPFMLDGWVSVGLGREYDGYLEKDGKTVEALEGRFPENAIQR